MQVQNIILAYSTDEHHTRTSKELIGVFSSKKMAIKLIKPKYQLTKSEETELFQNSQTQGRDCNIIFEAHDINEI